MCKHSSLAGMLVRRPDSVGRRPRPGSAGSMAYDSGSQSCAVGGTGREIGDIADRFHYAYQSFSDNGAIVARIDRIGGTDSWAQAGVMMRETLEAGGTSCTSWRFNERESPFCGTPAKQTMRIGPEDLI